jgi:hypothetical protein
VIGLYALVQALVPLLPFGLAVLLPARRSIASAHRSDS